MSRLKLFTAMSAFLALTPLTALADGTIQPPPLGTRSPVPGLVRPVTVPSDAPHPESSAAAATPVLGDSNLGLADAKKLFSSFEVAKEGNDPASVARVFGIIPQPCFALGVYVSNSTTETGSATETGLSNAVGKLGFRINVTSAAKACLEAKVGQPLNCGVSGNCVRFSEIPSASLALSGMPDAEIVLFHENPNADRVRLLADSFTPAITFESATTTAAKQNEAVRVARDKQIKDFRSQVQNCRKDESQIAIARSALDGLLSMGEIRGGQLDSISKELDKTERGLLCGQAKDISLDDTTEYREKLNTWAAGHADDKERMAGCYFDLAQRYATEPNLDNPSAGIATAISIMKEAKGLGLSRLSRNRADAIIMDFSLRQNESLAASGGWQNNMALQASLQNLVKGRGGLDDQYKSACRKFLPKTGFVIQFSAQQSQPSQEELTACSNARDTLARANAIATTGMMADRQSMMAAQPQNGSQNTQMGNQGFGQSGFGQNPATPQQNQNGNSQMGSTGFGPPSSNGGFGQSGNPGFTPSFNGDNSFGNIGNFGNSNPGNTGYGGGGYYGSTSGGSPFGNGFGSSIGGGNTGLSNSGFGNSGFGNTSGGFGNHF